LLLPFVVVVALLPAHPWAGLALLALPAARPPVIAVTGGAHSRDLIPALAGTARAQLSYGLLLALALSFSS
jgi:1,4-dihydroxy-2-naphthoate octaprenyltransferase